VAEKARERLGFVLSRGTSVQSLTGLGAFIDIFVDAWMGPFEDGFFLKT
jgi:hypothetical protein